MPARVNYTGKIFGRLKVISESKPQTFPCGTIARCWKCHCDCGKEIIVRSSALKTGNTKSCGCLTVTHGKTKTKTYAIWKNMKYRCNTSSCAGWINYGGR